MLLDVTQLLLSVARCCSSVAKMSLLLLDVARFC